MKFYTPTELESQESSIKEYFSTFPSKHIVQAGFGSAVYKDLFGHLSQTEKEALSIIDCGTANGDFIQCLYNDGFRNLYGADIDDYRREERKKIYKDFQCANLGYDTFKWQDNYFDVVSSWCLLPHLENPQFFVREAHRIVKEGGTVIMQVTNVRAWKEKWYFVRHGDFRRYNVNNNHIAIFTPAIMEKTVLKHFELQKMFYYIYDKKWKGLQGKIRKWNNKYKWFGQEFVNVGLAHNVVYVMKKTKQKV